MSEERKWTQHEINEDLAKGIEKLSHRIFELKKVLQKVINALRITDFGLSNSYGKELLEELDGKKGKKNPVDKTEEGCE